jgi:predicted transcriptional regulator
MQTAKQAAQKLLEQVPDQASWDDIMYELYVKQKLEDGLKAVAEGRTVSHEEAKRRLLGDAG